MPSVAVSSPISTLAKVDLPQPDSPTMATRLGLARLEGDRLVGLDRPRLAAAEDGVGRDLVVFLQIVDLQHRLARRTLLVRRASRLPAARPSRSP